MPAILTDIPKPAAIGSHAQRPPGGSSVDRHLADILCNAGLLSRGDATGLLSQAAENGRPLWELVLDEKKLTEDQLAETLARHVKAPYIKLASTTIEQAAVSCLTDVMAHKLACMPLRFEDPDQTAQPARKQSKRILILAMVNPTDLQALLDLEFSTGMVIKPVVATRSEIFDAIARSYATDTWMNGFLKNLPSQDDIEIEADTSEDEIAPGKNSGQLAPAVKLVNLVVHQAIKERASDIHIEPTQHHVQIRMRREGLLREFMRAPKWLHEPIVSRLKILAKLDIAERRRPQDGQLRVKVAGSEIDLRVSTLPTHSGEKVVLRILGSSQSVAPTRSMGMEETDLKLLVQAANQPQGLILVTGPTGSGKTSTLYSLVNERKNPSVNIVTVEDPIEFHLPGINQVQVNNKAGVTFATTLRSILRQDPDVILVGEIRDAETAQIAFHAANTGHLVLSTLHTNSSIATVSRLMDLGVDPYLIASATNLILAQRLVRKICLNCRETYQPDPQALKRLNLQGAGITLQHGRGCETCGQSGYSGRVGIFELLRLTPAIRKLVASNTKESDLRIAAGHAGMKFLLQEAIDRVKEGVTTVEEVLRVIQIQDDDFIACPKCCLLINREFSICPYCAYAVRRVCPACHLELNPEWRICPYCVAPSGAPAAAVPGPEVPRPVVPRPDVPRPVVQRPDVPGPVVPSPSVSGPGVPSPVASRPVVPKPVDPSSAIPSPATASDTRRKPRILVVDDDLICRRLAAKSLEKLELAPEVVEASSGAEALAAVKSRPPDLIVLDVMMPGMSGFEVCEALRSNVQTAFIPILMLTANIDEDSRTKGFLVGTDDYMGKPFSVPELHVRIKRLLRRTYGI